tara:strand:+ start:2415 stop:3560 length:1146 start_codon:yes stop_codon:yes gene_type:complete
MFNYKSVFAVFSVLVLTSCSATQPRAPLYDAFDFTKMTKKSNVQDKKITSPQYRTVKETIEKKVKVYHTVKQGEYVYSIAREYKVAPGAILKNNKLKRNQVLKVGQKLYIKTEVQRKVVNKKELVRVEPAAMPQDNSRYSLTRNPKLYNQNTAAFRQQKAIPRQDLSKPNADKNLDFGYHKVKRGENLFRIGRKYGVSVFDLMAYNDIKSPQDLRAGQELKIPVAKPETKVEAPKQTTTSKKPDVRLKFDKIDKDLAKKKGFIRPVDGRIISTFGKKGHGIRNDGIDIAVPIGTPVRASQQGTVMYAENVSVLGQMVLIKHRSGYISAYTHNSKVLVRKGQRVAKGEVIALSGDSGNAKQPMLHFEIRRYGKAINPSRLLK